MSITTPNSPLAPTAPRARPPALTIPKAPPAPKNGGGSGFAPSIALAQLYKGDIEETFSFFTYFAGRKNLYVFAENPNGSEPPRDASGRTVQRQPGEFWVKCQIYVWRYVFDQHGNPIDEDGNVVEEAHPTLEGAGDWGETRNGTLTINGAWRSGCSFRAVANKPGSETPFTLYLVERQRKSDRRNGNGTATPSRSGSAAPTANGHAAADRETDEFATDNDSAAGPIDEECGF